MLKKIMKKRGFTLIEMLVVIAIIAVLVSIIMPVVNNATTKAAAATNAANLRSVEGQIATLMFNSPELFETDLRSDIENVINNRDTLKTLITDLKVWGGLVAGTIELDKIVENLTANDVLYAHDGEINVGEGANAITIVAPAAAALSIEGYTVTKTTQMTVVIGEDHTIVATYDGMPSEAFAVIAEGGKSVDVSEYDHSFWDSNNDGKCDTCGGTHRVDCLIMWDRDDDGICDNCGTDHTGDQQYVEDVIGGAVADKHNCSDADNDGDHICDTSGCGKTASDCNGNAEGCMCSECGSGPHHVDGDRWYQSGYGKCDKCGADV